MSAEVRVAVAAETPVARVGLAAVLRDAPGIALVAIGDLDVVADRIGGQSADVLLIELALPDDSHDAPRLLRNALGDDLAALGVVLLTDASADVAAALVELGGRAILPIAARPDEIVAAIQAAAAGLVVLPAALAQSLVAPANGAVGGASRDAHLERAARAPLGTARDDDELPPLTPRELEVLQLLADGAANKQIAARLGISEHTVKAHVTAIFDKLGVSTRAEAVARAARRGVLML